MRKDFEFSYACKHHVIPTKFNMSGAKIRDRRKNEENLFS